MIINTNFAAMSASRLLQQSVQGQRRSLARLASGARIVSPEDDAAGLAVSMKLTALANRDNAVQRTLGNAISFAQTQDGYLQKVQKALDRMSELSLLAQDATKTNADRENYDSEFQHLVEFINEAFQAKFNDVNLFGAPAGVTVADFTGDYAVGNWTETKINNNGDGSVNTASAPTSITITGPDAGGTNGVVKFEVTATASGTVSFNYNFSSSDPQSAEDDAGYLVNGVYTQLVNTGSQGSGSASFTVNAGDTFGFSVRATDNTLGPGIFTITNFQAPAASSGTTTLTGGDGSSVDYDYIQSINVSASVDTATNAASALTSVKTAIEQLSRRRAEVGAKIGNLQAYADASATEEMNLRASVSRITDTDIAMESTTFARQSILTQSGTAMLAQANMIPQSVLRLLG